MALKGSSAYRDGYAAALGDCQRRAADDTHTYSQIIDGLQPLSARSAYGTREMEGWVSLGQALCSALTRLVATCPVDDHDEGRIG
jgi:hypothetical protein